MSTPERWEALAGACGGTLKIGTGQLFLTFTAAVFSACHRYRYALIRRWDGSRHPLVVIGLNPSTADEDSDDATITRCTVRARANGFGSLIMLNLFAFRATNPKAMLAAADPIGPANDVALTTLCRDQFQVLVGWGRHGNHRGRQNDVRRLMALAGVTLWALKLNQDGTPVHPLYQPYRLVPRPWGELIADTAADAV